MATVTDTAEEDDTNESNAGKYKKRCRITNVIL
jgi:hypothetical protein